MSPVKHYRTKDGRQVYTFRFDWQGEYFDIYCLRHPSLNGQSADCNKTHLFDSGKICFVSGREPRTQPRAEELAKQWAEYYSEYSRTGVVQS